jgi:general nucleoside transport system permease protein
MAVPTTSRASTSKLTLRLRKFAQAAGRPLFAVLLAIVAGAIVIMITAPGSPLDRFNQAINAYQALFVGAFGNAQNLSFTLTTVTPLILASISVAIAFRAGLFNIGAAGQLAMGAMTAGIIGFKLAGLPGGILVPLMLLGSILAGTVWGGIVGILKAWRGAHEVVTTIMLNWTAFYFTDFLIDGPFRDPHQATQTPALPPQATLPHIADFYNSTLGAFLPKIDQPAQYLVDVGLFFALLALVVYWFIISRTTFGYEIRVIGQNIGAAKYAGIPIKRNIFAVMAIAGAFSGLAGGLQLMGQFPYTLIATTFSIQTTGFDAIGVAVLGRATAIGILLASLLFGGLRQGGTSMQLNAGVPGDLVFIIQALVLFSIASEFLPVIQRSLPQNLGLGMLRRPSIVPVPAGMAMTELPDNENTNDNGTMQDSSTPEMSSVETDQDTAEISSNRSEKE